MWRREFPEAGMPIEWVYQFALVGVVSLFLLTGWGLYTLTASGLERDAEIERAQAAAFQQKLEEWDARAKEEALRAEPEVVDYDYYRQSHGLDAAEPVVAEPMAVPTPAPIAEPVFPPPPAIHVGDFPDESRGEKWTGPDAPCPE